MDCYKQSSSCRFESRLMLAYNVLNDVVVLDLVLDRFKAGSHGTHRSLGIAAALSMRMDRTSARGLPCNATTASSARA